MSSSIDKSIEYRHLIAQGVSSDTSWSAVWIDRAYNHLVRNGVSGAEAYGQAVAAWTANGLDIDAMTPEDLVQIVSRQSCEAQHKYTHLDPRQPEASFVLQHGPDQQRKPS